MNDKTKTSASTIHDNDAAQHVAEAHRILNGLRHQLQKHPELEEAISNLEMALSILTTKTSGML